MMFFWFPLALVLGLFAFRGVGVGRCVTHAHTVTTGGADPVEIARMRLARGEITPGEFEEIRRTLG